MTRNLRFAVLIVLTLCRPLWALDDPWHRGRIEDVQKTVDTKTLYWIANTPITQDEITYTISVHLDSKLVIGTYQPDKVQDPPPEQWTTNRPVKVQVAGDYMFLKLPTGSDLKLRINKRKSAGPMAPITDSELAEAYRLPDTTPSESMVGLSSSTPRTAKADVSPEKPQAEQPKSTQGPFGMVSITTVPYLTEIFVDGKSIGYSPAKLSLAVGKHTLRFEKGGYQPQSKEITVMENSEFTVYANLEKK